MLYTELDGLFKANGSRVRPIAFASITSDRGHFVLECTHVRKRSCPNTESHTQGMVQSMDRLVLVEMDFGSFFLFGSNKIRNIRIMEKHLVFYYIGISIVVLSHLYMAFNMSAPAMRRHALLNLLAAAFIAYFFLFSQGFIQW